MLPNRGANSWKFFDYFLELFLAFGLYSPEEIVNTEKPLDDLDMSRDTEAYQIGLEYYFRRGLLENFGDFVLGEDSPLNVPGFGA